MQKKIAVNIIMGFLGVGKTTAILKLLQRKPGSEKWAVLVNEFGEVGIDGAILSELATSNETNSSAAPGITISEVPGGCLCCVSGIPFQAALSTLIAQEKPDRILIEPTGLGHPKNLIRNLTSKEYAEYCDLKASICLIDPRQLKDPRYQQHETFNDQCYLADVLVANKIDLYSAENRRNFEQYADSMNPKKSALGWVNNAQLELSWLDLSRDGSRKVKVTGQQSSHFHKIADGHSHSSDGSESEEALKPVFLAANKSYKSFENNGMGYYSLGWLFAEDQIFNYDHLKKWLMMLDVERVKGLLITNTGTYVMNLREQVFTEMPTRVLKQSRLEIIHNEALDKDDLEKRLIACLMS